eukprot:2564384-Prorocentrum_lima.AAC.1
MAQSSPVQKVEKLLRKPSPKNISKLLAIIEDSIQSAGIQPQVILQLPPEIVRKALQQELSDIAWLEGLILSSDWHERGWLQSAQAWILLTD